MVSNTYRIWVLPHSHHYMLWGYLGIWPIELFNWVIPIRVYLALNNFASAGNRTRIYCLGSNNANHYTTNALMTWRYNRWSFVVLLGQSTPCATTLHASVGGVKVSIVAFQAIDPGSIPGWRTLFWGSPLAVFLSMWVGLSVEICGYNYIVTFKPPIWSSG